MPSGYRHNLISLSHLVTHVHVNIMFLWEQIFSPCMIKTSTSTHTPCFCSAWFILKLNQIQKQQWKKKNMNCQTRWQWMTQVYVCLYRSSQANMLRQTQVVVQQLFKLLLELSQLLPLRCYLQLGLPTQTVLLQLLLSRLYAGGS